MFLSAAPAYACRCIAPSPENAAQTYSEADSVVLAEPVFFSKGWGGNQPLVKLKIINVYKGSVAGEVTAQYNDVTAACGLALEKGKKYILGMFDMYSTSSASRRAGGFRLLPSCQQNNIYFYLMHPKPEDETSGESE